MYDFAIQSLTLSNFKNIFNHFTPHDFVWKIFDDNLITFIPRKTNVYKVEISSQIMKTSNVTIRIDQSIKQKIKKNAKTEGMSESEYVRRIILQSFDKDEQTEDLYKKVADLEFEKNDAVIELENNFISAMAYILSIDTGTNIHQTISTISSVLAETGYSSVVLMKMSREERDIVFSELALQWETIFKPSSLSSLVIESIFLALQSVKFSSQVFVISKLSIDVMNRFEDLKLEIGKIPKKSSTKRKKNQKVKISS